MRECTPFTVFAVNVPLLPVTASLVGKSYGTVTMQPLRTKNLFLSNCIVDRHFLLAKVFSGFAGKYYKPIAVTRIEFCVSNVTFIFRRMGSTVQVAHTKKDFRTGHLSAQ